MPNVAAPTTPFQSTTAGTGGTPKYYANQNVGGPYGFGSGYWPGAAFGAPGGGVPPTLPGAPGGAYGLGQPGISPIAYPQYAAFQVPGAVTQGVGAIPGIGGGGAPVGPPPGPPPAPGYGMLPGGDLAQMGAAVQHDPGLTWEQVQAGADQWLPVTEYIPDPGEERLDWYRDPSDYYVAGAEGGQYTPGLTQDRPYTNPYSYSEMIQAAPMYDPGTDALLAEMAGLRPEDPRGIYAGLLSEQMAMLESKETAAQRQARAMASAAGLGTSGKTGADIFGIGSQYAQVAGQTMAEHERALQAATDQYTQNMRDFTQAQYDIETAGREREEQNKRDIGAYAAQQQESIAGRAQEGFSLNAEFIEDWNKLGNYLSTSGVDVDSAKFIMDNLFSQWENSGFLFATNLHTIGAKKGKALGHGGESVWQYQKTFGDPSARTNELYAPSIDWGSLLGGIDVVDPGAYAQESFA